MAERDSWVVKFGLVDRPDQPILIHVSRKPDGHELDLDLLATDGESAYRAKLRERKLERLRDASYEGPAQEWSSILVHSLLPNTASDLQAAIQDSLDPICELSGKHTRAVLKLTFRTRVDDIVHKLGALELPYSENTDDVDLFGWTSEAVGSRDALSTELKQTKAQLKAAEDSVAGLQSQLQDLIKAKDEHEADLLAKFTLLLNEKKLRIRNQQRQLSHIDAPPGGSPSQPIVSKNRKTKNSKKRPAESDDESDAFETMEVDKPADGDDDEDDAQSRVSEDTGRTSTDSETVSESRPQALSSARAAPIERSRSAESSTPPRRELPFARRNTAQAVDTKKATEVNKVDPGDTDEETASEDDEL